MGGYTYSVYGFVKDVSLTFAYMYNEIDHLNAVEVVQTRCINILYSLCLLFWAVLTCTDFVGFVHLLPVHTYIKLTYTG